MRLLPELGTVRKGRVLAEPPSDETETPCDLRCWELAGGSTPNLLFTRQQRIVPRVLPSALLAGQVGWVVQPVRWSPVEERQVA